MMGPKLLYEFCATFGASAGKQIVCVWFFFVLTANPYKSKRSLYKYGRKLFGVQWELPNSMLFRGNRIHKDGKDGFLIAFPQRI